MRTVLVGALKRGVGRGGSILPRPPMTTTLHLPTDLSSALTELARASYPREACGLLVGKNGGEIVRVERVLEARNLNTQRAQDRFELDPTDLLAAEKEARAAGLEVVGVWHTHPDHPARPSETDRSGAWEGWSYVICSVTSEAVPDMRSWRLEGDSFREEEIRPSPPG